jgi:hypothetical protein
VREPVVRVLPLTKDHPGTGERSAKESLEKGVMASTNMEGGIRTACPNNPAVGEKVKVVFEATGDVRSITTVKVVLKVGVLPPKSLRRVGSAVIVKVYVPSVNPPTLMG